MKEVESIRIEEKDYIILDEIKKNEAEKYLYLVDTTNPENFIIQREVTENNTQFIKGLETEEEFDNILKQFVERIKSNNITLN